VYLDHEKLDLLKKLANDTRIPRAVCQRGDRRSAGQVQGFEGAEAGQTVKTSAVCRWKAFHVAGHPILRLVAADPPDIYPAGTQVRLSTVTMALLGAVELFNEITEEGTKDCGIARILDLAAAKLTRIDI
jgi:hypothetical protein